jgi:two-component system chemotaxis response regulator CheY
MKILVVDDSDAMRALIRRTLRGHRYDAAEIIEARNGREALTAILAARPDLVLANWNMPELSGIELFETLKRDGVSVKFGFITSDESPENRARAAAAGACFVIGKPFARGDLRRAVNDALGPSEPADLPELSH